MGLLKQWYILEWCFFCQFLLLFFCLFLLFRLTGPNLNEEWLCNIQMILLGGLCPTIATHILRECHIKVTNMHLSLAKVWVSPQQGHLVRDDVYVLSVRHALKRVNSADKEWITFTSDPNAVDPCLLRIKQRVDVSYQGYLRVRG